MFEQGLRSVAQRTARIYRDHKQISKAACAMSSSVVFDSEI